MPWLGMNNTCYGEDVDFQVKRREMNKGPSDEKQKWAIKLHKGTCKENHYGNKGTRKDLRNFTDIGGFPMIMMNNFEGKKFCGEKLPSYGDLTQNRTCFKNETECKHFFEIICSKTNINLKTKLIVVMILIS